MAARSTDSGGGLMRPDEYKVIIIGAVGVGKTSLLIRYVHNEFSESVTKFVSEERKNITINGKEMTLHLWDTAGQERYQTVTHRYYEKADAVILVYSIHDEESFRDIEFWMNEVHHYLSVADSNIPVLIVGNKLDLSVMDHVVNFRTVQELTKSLGTLPPVQCSAKTGENVRKVFHIIATELYKINQCSPAVHVTPVTKQTFCSSCSQATKRESPSETNHLDVS